MKKLILPLLVSFSGMAIASDGFYLERNGTRYYCEAEARPAPTVISVGCECIEISESCLARYGVVRTVSMSDGSVIRNQVRNYGCSYRDNQKCISDATQIPECRN